MKHFSIKNLPFFSVASAAILLLISCGSTKVDNQTAETDIEMELDVQEVIETAADEAEFIQQEDEYTRSVGTATVSKDTFENDKAEITEIISELAVIMRELDYRAWLLYIDDESLDYWRRPANLRKAQGMLPIKGLRIDDLEDYFKYVFVPSRAGREVSEIRYESDTYVKAVQVVEPADKSHNVEEKNIVYYYFNKIDGHWKLHLPKIDS